jgi:hypothetical protein
MQIVYEVRETEKEMQIEMPTICPERHRNADHKQSKKDTKRNVENLSNAKDIEETQMINKVKMVQKEMQIIRFMCLKGQYHEMVFWLKPSHMV